MRDGIGCQPPGYARLHTVVDEPAGDLASNLRSAREGRGWNQSELGRRSGVSQPTISKIESGKLPDPGVINLSRLAKALGVTADELIGGSSTVTTGPAPDFGTLSAKYEAAREAGREWLREEAVAIESTDAGFEAAAGRPVLAFRNRRRVRHLYEVRITGRCMSPRVEPGDTVLVDPEEDWAEGQMVVAVWNGQAVLKSVARVNGMLVLKAKDGTVLIPEHDTTILGVVVYLPAHRAE